MWLDLNGSPSLNYIHFTCHLVFKYRNRCSLGEKKKEPASVYDMPLERTNSFTSGVRHADTGAAAQFSIQLKLHKLAAVFKTINK